MPLVSTHKINTNEDNLAKIAGWVIEYKHIGYQYIHNKLFVYKIPTIGDLLAYEIAEAQSISWAAHHFLNKISLLKPKLRLPEVTLLVGMVIEDHFPSGEEGLRNDIKEATETSMSTMVGMLDVNLKSMNVDKPIEDMTYEEVLDQLAKKQILTKEPVLPGSLPSMRRNKHGNKQRPSAEHSRNRSTGHSDEKSSDQVDAGERGDQIRYPDRQTRSSAGQGSTSQARENPSEKSGDPQEIPTRGSAVWPKAGP